MNSQNILHSCIICQKKSPYNMQCRCLEWTCKKHRDQSKHNCKFDFSKHATEINEQNHQKVIASKITTKI
jgi:hypothetical protein